MTDFYRCIGILTLFQFLVSCQINPNRKPVTIEPASTLKIWQFKGRVAIKTAKESHIIRIIWKQNGDDTSLRLYGSFGKTYAYLETNSQIATLKVEDKTYQDTDPQRLLYDVLGWNIPVNEMQTWVKGFLPESQKNSVKYQYSRGNLIRLEYQPWTIDFNEYKIFEHYRLPVKLKLTHPKFSIKFSIQRWTIGTSS